MGNLQRLLEYRNADEDTRQHLLATNNYPDTYKKFLVKGQQADINELVISETLKTVISSAEERRVLRNIFPTEMTGSFKFINSFNTWTSAYSDYVPELGGIPYHSSQPSGNTLEVQKWGIASRITDNLIEDNKWNQIELEVASIGERLENTVNQVGISELLEGHSNTPADVDPAGAKIALDDILRAYKAVKDKHYRPSDLIVTPTAMRWLCSGNSSNVFSWLNNMEIGLHVLHDTTNSLVTSKFWDDTDASSHYQAILCDADKYARLVIARDITVQTSNNWKTIELGLKDLAGTIRFKFAINDSGAAVRILAK